MAKAKKPVNFEQALGELEALVTAMESGEMSLEDSLKAFEQGVRLTRECQEALTQAEQKVQLLLNESGETTDFDSSCEDPAGADEEAP
jgi:exodeoxyribonuclease VII small subunit